MAGDGIFEGGADGVGVGAQVDAAMELSPDGKEPGCDGRFGGVVVGENESLHDRADAVVNAEAGFVEGVEGEEDGVGGEEADALGKFRADEGGFERVGVRHVVVEEPCFGLVEKLVCWGDGEVVGGEGG